MISIEEIELRLERLRGEYRVALGLKREVIKRQARALQIAREIIIKKQFPYQETKRLDF